MGEARKKLKISEAQTRKFLKLLQGVKLIEVHPYDKVKLRVKGEPVWRKEPLWAGGQTVSPPAVQGWQAPCREGGAEWTA